MINWPLTDRLQKIKDFKPVKSPSFDEYNSEDTYRFTIWKLYDRVCNAIKSFVILYENDCLYDAYVIAGQALETCSLLCFITSSENQEKCKDNYNKYLASNIMNQIIEGLYLNDTLGKGIAWKTFSYFLEIFYPYGKFILKENRNYEKIIKLINYRKGSNIEKIKLFTKNFSQLRPSDYIQFLSNSMNNPDEGHFNTYYKKYCQLKHSNIFASFNFEKEFAEETKSELSYLILGLIIYLEKYFPKNL